MEPKHDCRARCVFFLVTKKWLLRVEPRLTPAEVVAEAGLFVPASMPGLLERDLRAGLGALNCCRASLDAERLGK